MVLLILISKWDDYNLSSLDLCCSPTGRYLEDDALNYTKHDELDDCTLCEANYYGPKEGASQSSDCRACASGKFSAEGAESCVQCSSGTFQNQSTLNCQNCTTVRQDLPNLLRLCFIMDVVMLTMIRLRIL